MPDGAGTTPSTYAAKAPWCARVTVQHSSWVGVMARGSSATVIRVVSTRNGLILPVKFGTNTPSSGSYLAASAVVIWAWAVHAGAGDTDTTESASMPAAPAWVIRQTRLGRHRPGRAGDNPRARSGTGRGGGACHGTDTARMIMPSRSRGGLHRGR